MPVCFYGDFLELLLDNRVLCSGTVHLTVEIDTEQSFFFAIFAPLLAQARKMGGH